MGERQLEIEIDKLKKEIVDMQVVMNLGQEATQEQTLEALSKLMRELDELKEKEEKRSQNKKNMISQAVEAVVTMLSQAVVSDSGSTGKSGPKSGLPALSTVVWTVVLAMFIWHLMAGRAQHEKPPVSILVQEVYAGSEQSFSGYKIPRGESRFSLLDHLNFQLDSTHRYELYDAHRRSNGPLVYASTVEDHRNALVINSTQINAITKDIGKVKGFIAILTKPPRACVDGPIVQGIEKYIRDTYPDIVSVAFLCRDPIKTLLTTPVNDLTRQSLKKLDDAMEKLS